MLKIGAIILSTWSALNALPSLAILFHVLCRNGNAPGFTTSLTDAQVAGLPLEVLAAANSVAVYANGLNVALSVLFVASIWKGLVRGVKWVFWAVCAAAALTVLAGIGGDYMVGTRHPGINLISLALVAVGIGCSARGLFGASR